MVRTFGGVNTFFLGDFWQLRPTGQVALMSNPYAQKAIENARARDIMGMFWHTGLSFSLQEWQAQERILHLDVNERSGADEWFSNVLNSCREGTLSEDDYNFLHGYPTMAPIIFWYQHKDNLAWQHDASACHYQPYFVRDHWADWPADQQQNFECIHCWTERKRRARVLCFSTHSVQATEALADPFFQTLC